MARTPTVDVKETLIKEEIWKWNVNLAWELFSSGIYFYRKALNSKFEHQRHMYFKNGLLSIVTSVEAYVNYILKEEHKWSNNQFKNNSINFRLEFLGVDKEIYSKSKNLRNDFIIHHKNRDHRYFDEINENAFLESIEAAQEIIAMINFNKKRLFPYWITGVNFVNPSHNYDLDLSNNIEFWKHIKCSYYLNTEIFDIAGNLIYNIDEYDKYKELYFELWNKIKKENFQLKFHKDDRFPKIPILSCEFWD